MKRTMTFLFAATLALTSSMALANDQPYEDDGSTGGGGTPADVRSDSPSDSDVRYPEEFEDDKSFLEGFEDAFDSLWDGVLNIVIAVPDHRSTM